MTCKICKWANHPPYPKNIPCCDCKEECNSRQCVEEPKTETKVCSKCGRELPLTDFYRNRTGYRAECKHCSIERTMHQRAMIKDWLEQGNTIDGMIALNLFGCFRLPSRICDLKQQGMKITDRWKVTKTGKRVKEYLLAI